MARHEHSFRFARFATRGLPSYWDFISGREHKLFLQRKAFEQRMDELHEKTWSSLHKEGETAAHEKYSGASEDLRRELSMRGVLGVPTETEEFARSLGSGQKVSWSDLKKAFKTPPKKGNTSLKPQKRR